MPECEVIIDSCEGKIKQHVERFPGFRVAPLKPGDISFLVDGKEVARAERKEVNDLISSIFDKRWEHQKAKMIELRKELTGVLLFYIIEGDLHRDVRWGRFPSLTPDSVRKVVAENWFKFGIGNMFTDNLEETIELIGRMQECYSQDGSPEQMIALSNPLRHVPIKKTKSVTDVKFLVLTAINGVTFDTAVSVFKEWKSLPALLKGYEQCQSEKERCALLQNILRSEKDKSMRIGPALSARIYRGLMSVSEESSLTEVLEEKRRSEQERRERTEKKNAKKKASSSRRDSSPKRKKKRPSKREEIVID